MKWSSVFDTVTLRNEEQEASWFLFCTSLFAYIFDLYERILKCTIPFRNGKVSSMCFHMRESDCPEGDLYNILSFSLDSFEDTQKAVLNMEMLVIIFQ
jgi:hypothetical protein